MTNERKDSCWFLTPGKLQECGILNGPCAGDACSFRKTEREYFEARNRAIELNRRSGRCAKCKYKPVPCEPVQLEEEELL